MLVFSLWGNSFRDDEDPMTESIASLQEHVSALLENTSISRKLHFTVNPMTGSGIKEAIESLVIAVLAKRKEKSDSVLAPNPILVTSVDSESYDEGPSPLQLNIEEGVGRDKETSKRQSKRKKCCTN